MDNLFTLLDKLLPLLSTFLGAYITYYVTISSKKKEIQVNTKIKARDEYWIPLCKDLEKLLLKIQELTEHEGDLISFYGDDSCENESLPLLNYLQPENRNYFYPRTRNILALCNKTIQVYENTINSNINLIKEEFRKLYYQMLENFSVYKINNCIDCGISFRKDFDDDIKKALLSNKRIDWMGRVKSVSFFREGEPSFLGSFSANMYSIDDLDFYSEIWLPIHENEIAKEVFGLNDEQNLGLSVLDYEYEHIDVEVGEKLDAFIQSISIQEYYISIIDALNLLHNEILKNIDESTIL